MPLPTGDIVFSKSFRVLEAGTTAFLKKVPQKRSQDFLIQVAAATGCHEGTTT
jgi:hypothetical protein